MKIDKQRIKQRSAKMTPHEVTLCRAVLGKLQRSVGLVTANIAAHVSMLQGQLATPTIEAAHEINKTVRMLSRCADLKWRYFKMVDDIKDVVLGVSSDVELLSGGWKAVSEFLF